MAGSRAADQLAERLRGRILDGGLAPGERLPTERELAEQTGVGRSSVREALRALESQGLVVTRPGRGGGTLVARPTSDELAASVRLFIRSSRLDLGAIVQARETVEPACAALAALHRSTDDLEALAALTERMRASGEAASDAYLDANLEWHLRVAAASANPLFAGFMQAVAGEVRQATDVSALRTKDVRTVAVHAHDRILDAIRAGDAATARRRMDAHVRAYAGLLTDGLVDPPTGDDPAAG